MIERIALSQGGRVTSVDPATNTIVTDFGNYTADVASVIPPQKAGRIAEIAGAADNTGWCPIDPVSFASKLVRRTFTSSAMPASPAPFRNPLPPRARKARPAPPPIVAMLSGKTPETPRLTGACYNTVAPGYAFSLSGVYQPKDGQFAEVEGATQPGQCAARSARARSRGADNWFKTITVETFG